MANDAELCDWARQVARGFRHPDAPGDGFWDALTEEERRRALLFAVYEIRRVRRRQPQRTAMRLLRSWLSDEQKERLRRTREFFATGSAGGMYRFRPSMGNTEVVKRHGRRWFAVATICFHPPEIELPSADITLAHLLMILTDEEQFLAEANVHARPPQCWDGAWRRRLNARRRLDAEHIAADLAILAAARETEAA